MFAFTKAQQAIRKAAKDFAKGELDKDTIIQWEKDSAFPTEVWEKAADLGFLGMHFPEKYSGGGLGMLDTVVTMEEICRKDSTVGVALGYSSHASECLVHWGSEGLQEAFLPKVTEGEMLSAGAFGENQRGGDLSASATTAGKDGSEWVINGQKTHVANGGLAGFYIVLCKTGDAASLILVEADRAGLSVESLGRKLGGNMTPTANIAFDNVRVPLENLLGKEGQGMAYAREFTDEHKIILAAQALGTALGAYDRMMDYVKGREQFGRKLAQFQVSQHKIADMATKIELAALITYKAAWVRDQGKMDSHPVLHGQNDRLPCGHGNQRPVHPAFWRIRVHDRIRGGTVLPGRQDTGSHGRAAAVQKDQIAQSAIGRIR